MKIPIFLSQYTSRSSERELLNLSLATRVDLHRMDIRRQNVVIVVEALRVNCHEYLVRDIILRGYFLP